MIEPVVVETDVPMGSYICKGADGVIPIPSFPLIVVGIVDEPIETLVAVDVPMDNDVEGAVIDGVVNEVVYAAISSLESYNTTQFTPSEYNSIALLALVDIVVTAAFLGVPIGTITAALIDGLITVVVAAPDLTFLIITVCPVFNGGNVIVKVDTATTPNVNTNNLSL